MTLMAYMLALQRALPPCSWHRQRGGVQGGKWGGGGGVSRGEQVCHGVEEEENGGNTSLCKGRKNYYPTLLLPVL
jgi:hypothetical protein